MNAFAQCVDLRAGDSVRVRHGVLVGQTGRIIDCGAAEGDPRVTVLLDLFGCDVLARIDRSIIEHDGA